MDTDEATLEDTYQGAQAPQPEGSLSIQEAAIHFGVAEKTIRRRIKTGAGVLVAVVWLT